MIRHIPDALATQRRQAMVSALDTFVVTYCGRALSVDRCIDLQTVAIDEAECKACQRSDDRRCYQQWLRETGGNHDA